MLITACVIDLCFHTLLLSRFLKSRVDVALLMVFVVQVQSEFVVYSFALLVLGDCVVELVEKVWFVGKVIM